MLYSIYTTSNKCLYLKKKIGFMFIKRGDGIITGIVKDSETELTDEQKKKAKELSDSWTEIKKEQVKDKNN